MTVLVNLIDKNSLSAMNIPTTIELPDLAPALAPRAPTLRPRGQPASSSCPAATSRHVGRHEYNGGLSSECISCSGTNARHLPGTPAGRRRCYSATQAHGRKAGLRATRARRGGDAVNAPLSCFDSSLRFFHRLGAKPVGFFVKTGFHGRLRVANSRSVGQ